MDPNDVRHALDGPGFRVEVDAATGTVASLRTPDGFEHARRARRGLGDWRAVVRDAAGAAREIASHDRPRATRLAGGIVETTWDLAGSPLRATLRHAVEPTPTPSPAPVPAYVLALELANAGGEPLEVRDLALALPVNDGALGGVVLHAFASGHGSLFRIARAPGSPPGPDLIAIPGAGTAPEEIARSPLPDEAPSGRERPGTLEAYLFSAGLRERLREDGPNGHRSLVLEPGATRAFSLRFHAVSTDAGREKLLLASGRLSIRVVPGMVLPRDLDARVRIAADVPIRAMETLDGATVIDTVGKREKGQIFRVRVDGTGRRRIRIHFGKDEWTQISFLATAPLRDLVVARSRFVVENQRCLDPDDSRGRRHAFLPFDAARGAIAAEDDREDLASGRGGPTAGEALLVATKNAAIPDAAEIEALDAFAAAHASRDLAREWGDAAGRVEDALAALAAAKRATPEWPVLAPTGDAPVGGAAGFRAARSDAPAFERFGCERRWWDFPERGARREPDEVGLGVSAPDGAAGRLSDAADRALDVAYGACLAPFGNVEESGLAHAGYDLEPARRGFDPASGDASAGLVAALRALASIAVDDPEYGPLGYGCVLERRFDDWRVIPRDGLRRRVVIRPLGLEVAIAGAELAEVLAFESRSKLLLTLVNAREERAVARVAIRGLSPGEYRASVPARVERAGDDVRLEIELTPGTKRVELSR